jgi:hypothetical protein
MSRVKATYEGIRQKSVYPSRRWNSLNIFSADLLNNIKYLCSLCQKKLLQLHEWCSEKLGRVGFQGSGRRQLACFQLNKGRGSEQTEGAPSCQASHLATGCRQDSQSFNQNHNGQCWGSGGSYSEPISMLKLAEIENMAVSR